MVLAAAISPWAYQGGKWLAESAATRDLPGLIEWFAASCGRAKLGRFYDRSLLFSALVLLPFASRRIKRLRAIADPGSEVPRTRHAWKSAATQILTGCLIAGTILWGLGFILDLAGAYTPKDELPRVGKLFSKVFLPAVGASLVEEWLFRGILLGLWLRFSRPFSACLGSALLFSFLHFLKPPAGAVITDPTHALAGFQLLGGILLHFTDPRFFVADFASLAVVGLILAWARVRTGALWFSIGLHAGWIMVFKAYNLFYQNVPGHPLVPWGVGDSLRSGVLPLLTLAVTALACRLALRSFAPVTRASR